MKPIDDGYKFLIQEQNADGSFTAWSSPSLSMWHEAQRQPTLFHTSLIIDCLVDIAGTAAMRQKAADRLATGRCANGAWNYCPERNVYPDDLDDTACAIAALSRQKHRSSGAWQLGQFAQLIVSSESQTGGPYKTWLTSHPDWQGVDSAVNANIAYALALHQVYPSGLQTYIDQIVCQGNYQSEFYVDSISTIYFISRWYSGRYKDDLCDAILGAMNAPDLSPLQAALLLSAAYFQKIQHPRVVAGLLNGILAHQALDGSWAAEAFYKDPRHDGKQYYGGSKALTTAFVLQALSLSNESSLCLNTVTTSRLSLRPAHGDIAAIPDKKLRQQYAGNIRKVLASAHGLQISSAAYLTKQASRWTASATAIRALNNAGLHGWVAYTIYDDILDGAASADQLCLANMALRRSYDSFMQASNNSDYQQHVRDVFDRMDAANHWEVTTARAVVSKDKVTIKRLPDYGDYGQLAERSLGMSLPVCGVAVLHFKTMDQPEIATMQRFFKHFLIARQLNDDAHDWEDDLRAGQLSAVVVRLLQDYGFSKGSLQLDKVIVELQQQFWNHTIAAVVDDITRHVDQARQALDELRLPHPEVFAAWIDALQAAADAAIIKRDEAREFIAGFEANHAV